MTFTPVTPVKPAMQVAPETPMTPETPLTHKSVNFLRVHRPCVPYRTVPEHVHTAASSAQRVQGIVSSGPL